jgi:hypothetical protein
MCGDGWWLLIVVFFMGALWGVSFVCWWESEKTRKRLGEAPYKNNANTAQAPQDRKDA